MDSIQPCVMVLFDFYGSLSCLLNSDQSKEAHSAGDCASVTLTFSSFLQLSLLNNDPW